MAFNLIAMASNLEAMAYLIGLQPINSDGLQLVI